MKHELQWFLDRIGKTIFRGFGTCRCNVCDIVAHQGLTLFDKEHAQYVYDIQNELGIHYSDEKVLKDLKNKL
jgi:hypothetical protein